MTTDAVELLNVDAGLHVYEPAPVAVKVNDVPEQTLGVEGAIATVGFMVTINACVAEFVQVPFDPVTV